jgi:prophage antirepressor-like protein
MSEVIIYEDGKVALEIPVEHETIWLNAHQIADIFGVNRPAIVKHIGNIYKTGELDRQATCSILEQVAADGKTRKMNLYSLDMIISVGYRVNSKKATKFRIWATDILRRYLLNGYALDKERLQQQKLDELFATLQLIRSSIDAATLRESRSFVEIISNYAKSWALLQGYDEQSLEEVAVTTEQKFILDYDEATAAIAALQDALIARGEATELFGNEKAGEFKGNLLNIYQSFAGEELLALHQTKSRKPALLCHQGAPLHRRQQAHRRLPFRALSFQKRDALQGGRGTEDQRQRACVAGTSGRCQCAGAEGDHH